jgi:hypothetical protein
MSKAAPKASRTVVFALFYVILIAFPLAAQRRDSGELPTPEAAVDDETQPLSESDPAQRLMAAESLGGIKLGMTQKKLKDVLGNPKHMSPLELTEATMDYWFYPDKGLEITLSAGVSKTGAKRVVAITASVGCRLATARGIKIGSSGDAVRKAYGPFEDKENAPATHPNLFVAGSIYDGIVFKFKDNKVSEIFFGASAE